MSEKPGPPGPPASMPAPPAAQPAGRPAEAGPVEAGPVEAGKAQAGAAETPLADVARPDLPLPARASAVLWDLDGTLAESGPVIVASMRAVLAELGLPDSLLDPRDVVGPPMRRNLAGAGVPPELMDDAVLRYRRVYPTRAHEALAYPGIRDALEAVAAAGVPQAVATSKAQDIAETQLRDMGLADLFVTVHGSQEVDGWSTPKARVVAAALASLRARGDDVADAVMVGDRRHDVEGAAEHGVPTIAVEWGYGIPQEHALAAASVDTAAGLLEALGIPARD